MLIRVLIVEAVGVHGRTACGCQAILTAIANIRVSLYGGNEKERVNNQGTEVLFPFGYGKER